MSMPPPPRKDFPLWPLFSVLFAFLCLLSVNASYYTIPSGYIGVLATFGKYSDQIKTPGLHFKLPWVQEVTVMDVKLQTAHYQNEVSIPEKEGVISRGRIVVLDSKNLSIGMDLTLQFAPIKEQGKEILERFGRNYFDKLVAPILRDTVRGVVSQYQAEDIAKERSRIATRLDEELRAKFEKIPFHFVAVQLRHIDLPEIVKQKIQEVQIAKQEEQRLAMIEKQAEKQQKIKTIEANTKLIEVTTEAKADSEKKKIAADAEAYQIRVSAEAQATANKEIAQSLTSELIEYTKLRVWDGKMPQTLVAGENSPLLIQPKNGG